MGKEAGKSEWRNQCQLPCRYLPLRGLWSKLMSLGFILRTSLNVFYAGNNRIRLAPKKLILRCKDVVENNCIFKCKMLQNQHLPQRALCPVFQILGSWSLGLGMTAKSCLSTWVMTLVWGRGGWWVQGQGLEGQLDSSFPGSQLLPRCGAYSDFGTFEGTWSVGGDPLAVQCEFITSRKTR